MPVCSDLNKMMKLVICVFVYFFVCFLFFCLFVCLFVCNYGFIKVDCEKSLAFTFANNFLQFVQSLLNCRKSHFYADDDKVTKTLLVQVLSSPWRVMSYLGGQYGYELLHMPIGGQYFVFWHLGQFTHCWPWRQQYDVFVFYRHCLLLASFYHKHVLVAVNRNQASWCPVVYCPFCILGIE